MFYHHYYHERSIVVHGNALSFTPASYLEQVDDERAAVTQVVNDLKVADVAVH